MSILMSVVKNLFQAESKSVTTLDQNSGFSLQDIRQAEGGCIIVLTAASEGNALEELNRLIIAPFETSASRIELININNPEWISRLKDCLEHPVWFAASYFGIGQNIPATAKDGRILNLWEAAGIPFIRFYGDIPAYFPDRHVAVFGNSINAYYGDRHLAFYRRWFTNPALSLLSPPLLLDKNPLPIDEIDIDNKAAGKIIFPKNGNSPHQLIDYWKSTLPSKLLSVLIGAAEDSISKDRIDTDYPMDDLIIEHFARFNIDISAEPAVLCFMVAQLDDYVRRIKSTMIAEALLDLPVEIRGTSWEHVNFAGKKATYVRNSSYANTQALIDRVPAIIDMSPNLQNAPHDRICRAIGRGTAFLTNKQRFLEGLVPNSERFMFSFEPKAIRDLIEYYVFNPREAIDLGIEQARLLREPLFNESRYVDTLKLAVQTVALRYGGRPPGTQNFVDFPPKNFG